MPMYLATASQEMHQIRTMLATGDIRGKRVTGFFNDWLRFSYLKSTKCGIHLDEEDWAINIEQTVVGRNTKNATTGSFDVNGEDG